MVEAANQSAMAAAKSQAAAVAQDWPCRPGRRGAQVTSPPSSWNDPADDRVQDGGRFRSRRRAQAPAPAAGAAGLSRPSEQKKIDAACKAVADYRATLPAARWRPAASTRNQGAVVGRARGGRAPPRCRRSTGRRRRPEATRPPPTRARPGKGRRTSRPASYSTWLRRRRQRATGTQALPAAGADTGSVPAPCSRRPPVPRHRRARGRDRLDQRLRQADPDLGRRPRRRLGSRPER